MQPTADTPQGARRGIIEWELLLALALSLMLILPYARAGLPVTNDGEIHLHRMISAAVLADAGYAWPRWTPYLHHGYGYPLHNFYAPGLHIAGATLWRLTGMDAIVALKLVMLAALLLYPLGAYGFARALTGSPRAALLAALAFTFAPMRIAELMVQGNFSQMAAMGLMVWVFWAVLRLVEQPTWRRAALLGLSFAGVILLHHPTGFLMAPFAALYALALALARRAGRLRAVLRAALGFWLGLGIAAIFWLPALLELRFVNISSIQVGMFNAAGNLIPLEGLLRPFTLLDDPQAARSLLTAVGLPAAVLALGGLMLAVGRWRALAAQPMLRVTLLYSGAAMLLCLLLMSPAAAWLWTHLPIANLVVFPWRLLGVAAVMGVAGAALLLALPARWQGRALLAAGAAVIALSPPFLTMPLEYRTLPDYSPAQAFLYERTTGNMGLTSANEYLPLWVRIRPQMGDAESVRTPPWNVRLWLRDVPPGFHYDILREGCPAGSSCYRVDMPADGILQFNQMYFPGLEVTRAGVPLATRPDGDHGLLTVGLARGEHFLRVTYAGTPLQHGAALITVLVLALAALMLALPPRRASF